MARKPAATKTRPSFIRSVLMNDNNTGSGAKSSDPLLRKLFIDSIRDIYWAEKALIKALGKMRKASTSMELQEAFDDHLDVTETHIGRLEEVFALLDEKARAKKCEAMEGLIAEGQTIIDETEKNTATRDVGLILAAQKVEHYEIATYGGLAQLARTLGEKQVAALFEATLKEEKEADAHLTQIAENNVNYEAASEQE